MLTKLIQFVKTHQADIILLIGVILISLLSFAVGYIVAKQQEKEPIKIEKNSYEITKFLRKYETENVNFRIFVRFS